MQEFKVEIFFYKTSKSLSENLVSGGGYNFFPQEFQVTVKKPVEREGEEGENFFT